MPRAPDFVKDTFELLESLDAGAIKLDVKMPGRYFHNYADRTVTFILIDFAERRITHHKTKPEKIAALDQFHVATSIILVTRTHTEGVDVYVIDQAKARCDLYSDLRKTRSLLPEMDTSQWGWNGE